MKVIKNQNKVLETAHLKEGVSEKKVLIVATEWNSEIVALQIEGAQKIAIELDVSIEIKYVPGAVELPFGIKKELQRHSYDAVIAFGAVIRGGTPHFEYVCKYVTEGVLALNLNQEVPIVFGVLTLDNVTQAMERLGGEHGHKGEEAMITALKMIAF